MQVRMEKMSGIVVLESSCLFMLFLNLENGTVYRQDLYIICHE